ncbi:MAG: hypothetical protein DMG13_14185 [Acidobacteria bacterium]|nr:MAG: hypothetical protein DMG13_14185 [Acidobacteriota bacterium]
MVLSLRKAIWLLPLIAGIAVLVFLAAAGPGRDRPVTVSVTRATRQNLSSWTTSNGKVEPVEPHVIQAQLTTFIEKIPVREGQTVKAGDTLLTLDARESQSELVHMKEQLVAAENERQLALNGGSPDEIAQLENDLAKTNSEIGRLRREAESLERLVAQQAATRQELDQNRMALEKAAADKRLIEEKKRGMIGRSKVQAERAALRAEEAWNSIRSLEQKVKSARVAAPVNGTIFSLPVRPGTFVHTGDVLAELADLTRVRVRAFIDEPELGSLEQGQTVEITWDALPNRVWMAHVEQLPKTIVARGSRNVGEVLCSVNNDESELLPNTNVNVRIRIADRQNVLAIPRAAVRSEDNRRYVFVIEADRLRKQEIHVGISSPATYEVLEGITENDLTALPGNADLHQGLLVRAIEQK